MKLKNIILYFMLAVTGFTACDKVDDLPIYADGVTPVLTSSANTIAVPASDSLKDVLTLTWSDPAYAADTATYKFLIEIDSTGRNFSKANVREVKGKKSTTFTARELNNIMLGYGFEFNKPYDLDVRVISSYANNNERKVSNVIKVKGTPYKIPPKVALPTTGKLFIVGSATQGDWGNPVPIPTQEFTRIDETTFGGIFQLNGGKEYLILPLNGNWDNKFSVANKAVTGLAAGGDFGFNLSDNFPGPAADGTYKIILDFQTGKFTVTPFTQQHGLPTELFVVGGATPGGWSNPVPVPSQQFTRINSTTFELASLTLKVGEKYLLLPENGNWGKKYGEGDKPGFLVPEGGDILSPSTPGNYKLTFNLIDNSLKVVKL